jgi:glycosyltransferase involved in cell wall biosynthesis
MPYFFRRDDYNIPLKEVIVFGFLGVASEKKGALNFLDLANYIQKNKFKIKSNFKLIGHITDSNINHKQFYEYICQTTISNKPLTIESFIKEANKLDYSVFCFPDSSYQLSCSATFFDAISFVKPIIALRTSFFDFYFKKLGDIGYLCDNIDDMKFIISKLLTDFDKERYDRQCQNILISRHKIGLTKTANQIKDILN